MFLEFVDSNLFAIVVKVNTLVGELWWVQLPSFVPRQRAGIVMSAAVCAIVVVLAGASDTTMPPQSPVHSVTVVPSCTL